MQISLNDLIFEDVSQTMDEKTITIHFRIHQTRYKLISYRALDTNRIFPVYIYHEDQTLDCPHCQHGHLQLCVELSTKLNDVFERVTQANNIRLYWVTHQVHLRNEKG